MPFSHTLDFFKKDKTNILWLLFGLAAIALTARNLLLPNGETLTHYNNYVIFKYSFFHLLQGQDLYAAYPAEHYDLFKYSPTFAAAMGLIAWMPDWLGLALWNLCNVCLLVFTIKKLPGLSKGMQFLFGILALQETITSTMNSQSNVAIVALLILAWVALENGNWRRAALFICITAFIKVFGILFFALFLLYPKWTRAILPSFLVFTILLLLPVPLIGFAKLWQHYESFGNLLANDHGTFVKYSVMGWLQSWFGLHPDKNNIVLIGLVLLFVPFLLVWWARVKSGIALKTRALCAAAFMIWMVIFNHMAESATFIIAVVGVLVWFFYSGLPKWWRIVLLIPVIVFTCFGPSDLYPPELRNKIVVEWQLKVFPCILVWLVCIAEIKWDSISSLTKAKN